MLEVSNISKQYEGFSLENLNFEVRHGSYTVLLGPSGAGKTQALEIIAGLTRPDKGAIRIDGVDVTPMEPRYRPVGIVFQDLAVFPHLSVEKNIAFPLHSSKLNRQERDRTVRQMAEKLGIDPLLQRMPSTLSGGELQRVALARTLVRQPRYLLLDEPLSSLDVSLRQNIFSLLKSLHHEGQTILHVTHNFEETLVLATDIAVINSGKIIQSGTAEEVFHRPGSDFVARFTGIRNYFQASLEKRNGLHSAILARGIEIKIATEEQVGEGYVLIPGEEIILSGEKIESSAVNQLYGTVVEIFNIPGGVEVKVDVGVPFFVKITRESLVKLGLVVGSKAWLSFKATGARFIRV